MADDKKQEPEDKRLKKDQPDEAEATTPAADDAQPADPKADELAAVKEQLLRMGADFENFKRRAAEDQARTVQVARTDVILDLLPVIDNFDRAFADVPKEIDGTDWFKGVQAIKQQFEGILKGFGIERIKSVGEEFDPELHEAVSHEPSDEPKDVIFKEFEAGYRLGDQVIRHARVAVSAGSDENKKGDS